MEDRMKKLIVSMVVLAGASLAVPALAADPMAPAATPGAEQGQMQNSSGQMNKADLVGRKVFDSKGKQVGQVKDVITDSQGATLNVIVATSKKDVALSPDEIKLASNDTLKANKTAKEINQLPAAPATQPDSPTGAVSPGTNNAPAGDPGNASGSTGSSRPAPAAPASPY
jgi:sporulation protein YlmC with PRC-barrel domain